MSSDTAAAGASASSSSSSVPSSSAPSSSLSVLSGLHILVTGGCGYIGSHTVLALLRLGCRVSIVDNLSNSSLISLERIEQILLSSSPSPQLNSTAPNAPPAQPTFHRVDLCDFTSLEKVFASSRFDACIHFAGLKSVGESVAKPLLYYQQNVSGTINLLNLLDKYNCRRLVFSSSATVYGSAEKNPIKENFPLQTTNPYGQTKFVIEGILNDIAKAPIAAAPANAAPTTASVDSTTAAGDSSSSASSAASAAATAAGWKIIILRYFNPIGADESGLIGEDPLGIPNNLLPFVMQVAVGRRSEVNVFGGDYPTPDGTGVRDYIHVTDLADGHIAALAEGIFGDALKEAANPSIDTFNLGSGSGVSVLDIISAASAAVGKQIPFRIAPRRAGDIAVCYADASKAKKFLKWETKKSLSQAVSDAWRWQSNNPNGFAKAPAIEREDQVLLTADKK